MTDALGLGSDTTAPYFEPRALRIRKPHPVRNRAISSYAGRTWLMRMRFDHGTLVFDEFRRGDLEALPGLVWDPRVQRFRAPAWRHADVLGALAERRVRFADLVRPQTCPEPATWRELSYRPYQRAALLNWELAGRRGIVVLPTGSGKTRVAMGAIASAASSALCLVPTRVLLDQWSRELSKFYSGHVGCLGDGKHALEAVTVATFESAYRLMPRIGHRFDLLIVDEVHHFGVGVRDEALEMSIAHKRLGLTATPPGESALQRLSGLIGPIVHREQVSDLAGTWLSDFDIVVVHCSLNAAERDAYGRHHGLFSEAHRRFRRLFPQGTWQEFVSAAGASREGRAALAAWRDSQRLLGLTEAKSRILRSLLEQHASARVLVFTADNDSAYAIAREHLIMPVTCDISRSERARALEAFRAGDIRTLVSARVLNEGLDVPDAEVAIVVSGSHGQREHLQRVGRLLRPVPGKRAPIYELVTVGTGEVRRGQERRRDLVTSRAAGR